jgi:ABC-type multidrug transport system fused ATPase/permease subunit
LLSRFWPPVTDPRELRSVGGLLNRFLRPYSRWLAAAVSLNVVVAFALTLRPLMLAPALDSFAGTRARPAEGLADLTLNNVGPTLAALFRLDAAGPVKMGVYAGGLFLLVTIATAALSLAAQALLTHVRGMVQRDMLVALHAHLLTLPLGYFHKRRAGELVTRLTGDVSRVAGALDVVVRQILQSTAQIVFTLAVMFRTDALFTLALLALGSVHLVITRLLKDRLYRLSLGTADRQGDVGARLLETFAGIRAIKSFAAERYESREVQAVAEAHRRAARRWGIASQLDVPIRMVADALVAAVILAITFHAVNQGRLTLQAAVLFFYLSQQFLGPMSIAFRQGLALASLRGDAARVLEMFATRSAMPDGTRTARPLEASIVLEGVSFSYEPGRPVLQDIDLEIRRGETVAVVGPSGSGKTTLADLLLRLFDVDRGAIRYDGIDIREFTQASYRSHFGVVAQDPLLFNATVRENIVFNRPADSAALTHALWAANAAEFVRELPQGLDTVLGDRGVRLSGGQRQRIAIARAIYGRPSVLLLDEATSALDSEAEREVQTAIERVGREMTTIVIGHRLSTVVHADRIVVLNRGRIEAIGPHRQVLETSRTYRRLYTLQAGAPVA